MKVSIFTLIGAALTALVAGYLLGFSQQRLGGVSGEYAGPATPVEEGVFELSEVRGRRDELEGQTITVIGAVSREGSNWTFLVPDDRESLLRENPGERSYKLNLGGWRFALGEGVYPRIAVTGRFGKLDDNIGYDALVGIESVSWRASLPENPN